MATREDLHHLVDELPEASLEPAARWLTRAMDPMVAILDAAPLDYEPLTEEERAAIGEPARDGARAKASRSRT